MPYKKGELKAIGYDENGTEVATEIKKSFGDPKSIILQPEKNPGSCPNQDGEELFFIDI